jgi:hypothetical protein
MVYVVFAAALSDPAKLTVLAPTVIDVRVGKFWRLFGPLSASSASFGVRPSLARSIASPEKEPQSFPRIALPVPPVTETASPLTWNRLACPAATPPIVLLLVATDTPAPPRGSSGSSLNTFP